MKFLQLKNYFLVIAFCVVSFFVNAQIPNVPGDFADPSVIKIGDTYYASATSSNWMPAYPVLKSKDLKNWEWVANIFPEKPSWAEYYFWAPELSYEDGKIYVYYTARRKGGALAVAVASANRPEGPYTDHGPLVEQPMGSIDGFPMRDENGKLFLIWKEDGNSQRKPTVMWIQQMNEARTQLIGERKEMFRDSEKWERNLVEAASILKHNNYFYTIYAAAACCGSGCTYATGVARSRSLHGPWEKYDKNPLLTEEGDWKCQGHGTAFKDGDKYYFLYHGYHKTGGVYTGRQGLLKEFRFTSDNWIEFDKGFIYSENNYRDKIKFNDNFNKRKPGVSWNWSVFHQPEIKISCGKLNLAVGSGTKPEAIFAQKTYTKNYTMSVDVFPRKSNTEAGIAIIGDDDNYVAAMLKDNRLSLIHMAKGKESLIAQESISYKRKIGLKVTVKNSMELQFAVNDGNSFRNVGNVISGKQLPPWDRALRAGLIVKGYHQSKGIFDNFILISTGDY